MFAPKTAQERCQSILKSENRRERDRIGGASATMIRAEVNAEDQINANAKPAKIARMSMGMYP